MTRRAQASQNSPFSMSPHALSPRGNSAFAMNGTNVTFSTLSSRTPTIRPHLTRAARAWHSIEYVRRSLSNAHSWGCTGPGGSRSLQNCCMDACAFMGGFDSHTPLPLNIPGFPLVRLQPVRSHYLPSSDLPQHNWQHIPKTTVSHARLHLPDFLNTCSFLAPLLFVYL